MGRYQILRYGPSMDDHIILESIMDQLKLVQCMKLYKAFDTLDDLEDALSVKALNKIKQIP